ncbi:MAG: tRNA (adenosine(37)-N6)-threonylcarbamoyltransferase complex dimerization subunit type 1 TsaB [Chitinispirillaceae bacterium]|nr:tRNA (adenosine(37)-N6)-threonylcarbamoyltransferase complex dimerization subunit type 1 TsaB [Chitinispirillaceae bacterium]
MNGILGIDTSSTELGLGLYSEGRPVASCSRYRKNSHAEHITQTVSSLLASCDLSPADITHIAIAVGPGSFTGLRIGLAFAKGFCFNNTVPLLPLSSLHILAHGARGCNGTVVAAIDARRNEVFCARFRCGAGTMVRVTEDIRIAASEFQAYIGPDDTLVTDTMGYARSTVFGFLDGRPNVLPVERHPFARGLVCAAAGDAGLDTPALWRSAQEVLPRYFRTFTAPSPVQEHAL